MDQLHQHLLSAGGGGDAAARVEQQGALAAVGVAVSLACTATHPRLERGTQIDHWSGRDAFVAAAVAAAWPAAAQVSWAGYWHCC